MDYVKSAKDAETAARWIFYFEEEIRTFIAKTLHYPLEEELEFYKLVSEMAESNHQGNWKIFAEKMALQVRALWDAKQDLQASGRNEELSRTLSARIGELQVAIENEDVDRVRYISDSSSLTDSYFRQFLAEINGTFSWYVENFEWHLVQAVSVRRFMWRLEEGRQGKPNDEEVTGLDAAKKYLAEHRMQVHMAWLTDCFLWVIFDDLIFTAKAVLDYDATSVRFSQKQDAARWLTNLTLFRDEIVSRNYDAKELVRRLRQHEDTSGTHVIPSLVYPLLELQMA